MRFRLPSSLVEVNHRLHTLNLIIGRNQTVLAQMLRLAHTYRVLNELQFALELVLAVYHHRHHHEHATLAARLRGLCMERGAGRARLITSRFTRARTLLHTVARNGIVRARHRLV